MQTCTHCKLELTLECFHRRLDGHLTICKQCAKQKRQAKVDPLRDQLNKAKAELREIKNIRAFEKLENLRARLARANIRPEPFVYVAPINPGPVPAFLEQIADDSDELAKALQVLRDADDGIY